MGMSEPVRSGTTVEELVRAIADDIVSGTWLPGARLDEVGLARRHAVSRTPVREALARLVAMGLVESRPNRGALVAKLGEDHLRSMFEAMTELEGICARLAAQRMSASERSRLEALHHAAMRLVHLGAEEDYARHNADFHSRLYDGAHSVHVCELAVITRRRLAPFRRAQFRMPGRLVKSWDEHDTIVRAIMRADVAGAEAAARAHVATVSDASSQFVRTAISRRDPV
ncbi:MAG: GntR family transcriptional regulator [Hyphomicrobiales bacterium]|nr:GntR family transcriptional regulator [Hyphomicrobiales bacterium]